MNNNQKRIMVYGDSLTWGRIAGEIERYGIGERFTSVLQQELGDDYQIIEEGLRGRMAKGNNPHFPHRDGFAQFPGIFLSHLPLDLLIIFLGTNDTNKIANKSAKDIANDLESYLPVIPELSKSLGFNSPQIMYVAPPLVDERYLGGETMFKGAQVKSERLVQHVSNVAEENSVNFFDSSKLISAGKVDGVHIDKGANIKLGKELANSIKKIV